MADGYATDDETVEQLKKWWKDNGRSLVIGVTIGLAAVFGWRAWTQYQSTQSTQASNYYSQLMAAVAENNPQAAMSVGDQIINNYSGTPYAALSALALARLRLQQGELTAARAQLQWALGHADMVGLKHIARIRLGRVMLAQGDADQALALVDGVKDQSGFVTQYQELLGDIYSKQGKTAQARAAYEKAVNSLAAAAPQRTLLQMKLDNLSGAAAEGKQK